MYTSTQAASTSHRSLSWVVWLRINIVETAERGTMPYQTPCITSTVRRPYVPARNIGVTYMLLTIETRFK